MIICAKCHDDFNTEEDFLNECQIDMRSGEVLHKCYFAKSNSELITSDNKTAKMLEDMYLSFDEFFGGMKQDKDNGEE